MQQVQVPLAQEISHMVSSPSATSLQLSENDKSWTKSDEAKMKDRLRKREKRREEKEKRKTE
jgi:hypothetical protein